MPGLGERMIRAAKLDASLYEEVEADTTAMGQAVAVVVIANVAMGIGGGSAAGFGGIVSGIISALAGWLVWSLLTFWIGTRLLPEPQTSADYGQLLRTIGFSASPGVIGIVGIIPGLRFIVFAVQVWMLVAMVVAVRQALDYRGTGRAVAVCLIGWVVELIIVSIFGIAAGLFARA